MKKFLATVWIVFYLLFGLDVKFEFMTPAIFKMLMDIGWLTCITSLLWLMLQLMQIELKMEIEDER